jgi:hypothetical protein
MSPETQEARSLIGTPPKYREQSAFPSKVLLSRASAGHWDLRKQYEIPATAEQKWTRRKKGLEREGWVLNGWEQNSLTAE